jgi:outer membrane lipoprotein SlyB
MRRIALIAFGCLAVAACNPEASTGGVGGAAVGATTGAVLGGPVGAVVGGGIGAAAGTTAGATVSGAGSQRVAGGGMAGEQLVEGPRPGQCYVADDLGNVRTDRRGRPVVTRC